ncbi:hypothetical protein [Arthrobacter psychrolactophilus]
MKATQQAVTFIPSHESRSAKRERRALRGQVVAGQQEPFLKKLGLLGGDEEGPATTHRLQPFGPHSLKGPHRLHPAPHRASTMTFAAAYPFITESGLGHEGTYIGSDVFGSGAFSYDPWVLYDKGVISGPSIVIIGTVGTGKSMCAKSLVARFITLGRKAAVASDPKGEWGPVANAVGGKVISVGPGRPTRVNPLDAGAPLPGPLECPMAGRCPATTPATAGSTRLPHAPRCAYASGRTHRPGHGTNRGGCRQRNPHTAHRPGIPAQPLE